MYSRPTNKAKDLRIPLNYGGSAFMRTPSYPIATSDPPPKEHNGKAYDQRPQKTFLPKKDPNENESFAEASCEEESSEVRRVSTDTAEDRSPSEQHSPSFFPNISSISTEDLLLIALALMIFQGGKDIELALILLALLFIS